MKRIFIVKKCNFRNVVVIILLLICALTLHVIYNLSSYIHGYSFDSSRKERVAVGLNESTTHRNLNLTSKKRTDAMTEEELLASVNRLPFKRMTPSSFLLEDMYFTPDERLHLSYKDAVILSPKDLCQPKPPELLILVPSTPESVQTRKVIRETWGSVASGKAWPWRPVVLTLRLLFVLGVKWDESALQEGKGKGDEESFSGKISDPHAEYLRNSVKNLHGLLSSSTKETENLDSIPSKIDQLHQKVHEEALMYNDILLFDMVDSYRNLTRKMILAFQYVATCNTIKYVLKVDQDIFINMPLLATFLKHHAKHNTIYGSLYPASLVRRSGKWSVDRSVLPIKTYPIYASGNAYVLTYDAVLKILSLVPRFHYVPVEDAFLTGILASVARVHRVHVSGFVRWTDSRPHACSFINDKCFAGNKFDEFHSRLVWRELVNKGWGRC